MLAAVALSCVLIGYSSGIVLVSAWLRRDSWTLYTVGNATLGSLLFWWVGATNSLAVVWGAGATFLSLERGAAVGAGLALPIMILAGLPTPLARSLRGAGVGTTSAGALVFRIVVQAMLTTVLFEEFVFRGVLQHLWNVATGSLLLAVLAQALVFSLWHTVLLWTMFAAGKHGRRGLLTGGGLVAFLVLGLVLGLTRWTGGSLVSPLAAHGTLDALMLAAMAVARRPVSAS